MTFRRRLNTTQRRALYKSAVEAACEAGKEFPDCNLCHLPIRAGEMWEESHLGRPAALGGTDSGVGHKRCNRIHGAKVVTPMVAKAKRTGDKFLDIKRSHQPMQGGRDDPRKRTMAGVVVDRRTGERWSAS